MKVKMLREKSGKLSLTVTSDVKGTGDAAGAGALKQDLDLVVGQSEMVTAKQPRPTEEAVGSEGAAWDEDTEERGDPGKDLLHVTVLSSAFFSFCIHQKRLCSAAGKSDLKN